MKTGLAKLILTHLSTKGPETSVGLVAALKFSTRQVATSIGTLQTDSKIQAVGLRKEWCEGKRSGMRDCHVYAITLLGRDALAKVQPSAMPKAVPKPPSRETGQAPQTVEEFLAAGGRIERLPTTWSPPTKYPPYRGIA